MGIECKIKFTVNAAENLDAILRQSPFFSDYDVTYKLYNYRNEPNQDLLIMPDAHAAIEPDGIYFCDNGGKISKIVLDHLKRTASQKYNNIMVEEL